MARPVNRDGARRLGAVFWVLTLLLCGCGRAALELDPDFEARSDEMPIERATIVRTSDATIGAYSTHVLRDTRGQEPETDMSLGSVDVHLTVPGWEVSYSARSPDDRVWITTCSSDDQVQLPPGCPVDPADSLDISCTIAPQDESAAHERWTLELSLAPCPESYGGPRGLTGRLTREGTVIEIVPSRARSGSSNTLLRGYTLRQRERTVAAVEHLYDGRVWMARSIEAEAAAPTLSTLYGLYLLTP